MKDFTQSLQFKVILLVIMVELLIFSGAGVFYTQRFSHEIDDAIVARLSIPGLLMTRGELNFDAVSDKRTMEELLREPYHEGTVIGLDGRVYFSSDPDRLDTHLDEIDGHRLPGPESSPASVDTADLITPFQDSTGTYLTCISPLRPAGKLTGYLYLKVGTKSSKVEKRNISLLFAISSLAAIVLTAAILTIALHWMVIKRLNVLVEIFRRFARGDYKIRAQPSGGNDEIETLMSGFNGLAERLEETMAHLSESESRFRVLVEHAPEAIVVYDVDTRLYVDANQNAERLFSCSLEQLRLSSPTDFFAPTQPDPMTVEQSVTRVLNGEEVVVERAILNTAGQELLCEVRLVLLPSINRRLVRASYIDITERKRADDMLRENERFLETVLEHIPIMLFVKDAHTLKWLRFNIAGEELIGYTRDELLGKGDHDLFPKEQADFFTSKDREIIENGELMDIEEEPIDTRNLGQRLLHTKKIPIYKDDGSPLYLLGISEDITERKLIEKALYFVSQGGWMDDAENFFDALARFLGISLDIDYVFINRLAEEPDVAETLAVYAKSCIASNMRYDLKGTPCENVVGKQLCSYQKGIQQLFPDDTLLAEMDVESYIGIPLWDSDAQPIGLIALMDCQPFCDDKLAIQLLQLVATRAAAELEGARSSSILRTREQEFRTLAENSPDNIARYDVSCRLVYANPALGKTLGCSASELINTTPAARASIAKSTKYQEKIVEVLQTGQEAEMDLTMPNSGEGERYHNIRFVPERGVDGAIAGVLAIGRDSTERIRAEAEVQLLNQELEQRVADRTAQLEEANKELEAFAYSVSHDLRAPLRHIDGFLELLQNEAGTELDSQSRRYMDTISSASKKMGQLIDDLLSFSRMGRNDMLLQPVDLGVQVRDVIRECEQDDTGRKIDWRITELPVVNGDAAMLHLVLTNLITNAMKYTSPRKLAEIEIGMLPSQDQETVIFVHDNGVGFDMAYVDKLFGVFQRLHRADEFEGTGIGLANVRRIIERHGGRTWAEGKLDHGASFYFSLPGTQTGT